MCSKPFPSDCRFVCFRLIKNVTFSAAENTYVKCHDIYEKYKSDIPRDKHLLSVKAVGEAIGEVFPNSQKTKLRFNSALFVCFSHLSLSPPSQCEATGPDLQACAKQHSYSVISDKTVCFVESPRCDGHRVIKEVTFENNKLSMNIAGREVFPDIPEIKTQNELVIWLASIEKSPICTGFSFEDESFYGDFSKVESWTVDGIITQRVRVDNCMGIIPLKYKGTCHKCHKKKSLYLARYGSKRKYDNGVCETNATARDTDETENESKRRKRVETNADSSSDSDSDGDMVFDDDPGNDPDYCPVTQTAADNTDTEQLERLLGELSDLLDATFIDLIKSQIRNNNVKDRRLRKYDMK